ncbi:methyltransferase [Rhodobacteraceae bacterium WD3A24]|nr:methyltransferase [Rhodobacteraceae bacterium WD3A24]
MTALSEKLARRIAATGPITLADFMAEALLDPEAGYYATRDPLGRAGDFTTAPEISQIFGECLGLCLAQAWRDQGAPTPFVLAELGPGRGTLMADLLRAAGGAVPGFRAAARIHLVEASPALRARQAAALGDAAPQWHDSSDALPGDMPLFLLANEFFDALPIRQFVRAEGPAWRERVVTRDADGALAFGLGAPVALGRLEHRLADTRPGDVVETCPAGEAIAAGIAGRIAERGGAALIVDYGGWRSLGDTFQAVAGHAPCEPLAAPGSADLTAHVDFEPLAAAARGAGASVSALTAQGVLLERLGITTRAQALARGLEGAARREHVAAHRRLTHPREMGTLFKALALHAPGSPPPAGFDPPAADGAGGGATDRDPSEGAGR